MKRYRLLITGSLITIILDQITKVWAVNALLRVRPGQPEGQLPENSDHILTNVYVVFESWFNFRLAGNKGAAWGIFGDLPETARMALFRRELDFKLIGLGHISEGALEMHTNISEAPMETHFLTTHGNAKIA